MVIDMNDEQLQTLAQLRAFLDGTVAVDFAVTGEARHDFIARTVRHLGYARLKRTDRGGLRFLGRVSGYSRQQLMRLVRRVRTQAPCTPCDIFQPLRYARTKASSRGPLASASNNLPKSP